MPRFGKDYKMYPRIIPSEVLDVTDIIEDCKCPIVSLVFILKSFISQLPADVQFVGNLRSMNAWNALKICPVELVLRALLIAGLAYKQPILIRNDLITNIKN